MAADYPNYQESLGIKVDFAGGIVGGGMVPLSADNIYDWLAAKYLAPSIMKHLNENCSSQEQVEAYLATAGNTITKFDDRTGVNLSGSGAARNRLWITPIYGGAGEALVVDVAFSWGDYLSYLGRTKNPPSHDLALIYNELAGWFTNSNSSVQAAIRGSSLDENGDVLPIDAAAYNATFRNLYTATNSYLGQGYDIFDDKMSVIATVMSDFGWSWIREKFDISVNENYKEFVEFQTHSMDPLYFILDLHDELKGSVDISKNWWIRQGAGDSGTGFQIVFNVADALAMKGYNVDAGLVWDQGHALSSDIDGFFDWANKLILDSNTDPQPEPITSLKIESPAMTTVERKSQITFTVALNEGASDEDLFWTVSDPSLASVDAHGTVTIFNKPGMVILTVKDPISGITNAIVLRIS
jgi:hypothetical protein